MMLFLLLLCLVSSLAAEPWKLHIIDNGSRGADGVRIADINHDGKPDIATGWEEGGSIRIYVSPTYKPQIVGSIGDPEDAVFADLDGDGRYDVISASEGKTRQLTVHWAPDWKSEPIPASVGKMQWMFTAPAQIDGRRGIDFFAAGKNQNAEIGWFESPANPRDLSAWRYHKLRDAGWIMSLIPKDMDGDGKLDLLFSDRKGPRSGVYWMSLDGREHLIGAQGEEVMFIDAAPSGDIVAAVKSNRLMRFHRTSSTWTSSQVLTPETAGHVKAVRLFDIDRDGHEDLIFTCEGARGTLSGVMYLKGPNWTPIDISGAPGIKYDLIELIDFDGDGDLDVLTTEEQENGTGLGVIWYENPTPKNP